MKSKTVTVRHVELNDRMMKLRKEMRSYWIAHRCVYAYLKKKIIIIIINL